MIPSRAAGKITNLCGKKHYGEQGAANFGIGSDSHPTDSYGGFEHGLFDHMQPELVVLNIGVNNLFGKSSGAKKIAAGVEKNC